MLCWLLNKIIDLSILRLFSDELLFITPLSINFLNVMVTVDVHPYVLTNITGQASPYQPSQASLDQPSVAILPPWPFHLLSLAM